MIITENKICNGVALKKIVANEGIVADSPIDFGHLTPWTLLCYLKVSQTHNENAIVSALGTSGTLGFFFTF